MYPGSESRGNVKVTSERPKEFHVDRDERHYPVKTVDGEPQRLYRRYRELARHKDNMTFIGRCGQYVYYDMHQAVANSLKIADDFLCGRPAPHESNRIAEGRGNAR